MKRACEHLAAVLPLKYQKFGGEQVIVMVGNLGRSWSWHSGGAGNVRWLFFAVITALFAAALPVTALAPAWASDPSPVGAFAWGDNFYGQLGGGTATTSARPFAVTTSGALAGKTLASISAGGFHTCAVASDGTAACWGYNNAGQLGNGTTNNSAGPVAVTTSGALAGKTLASISAGRFHTCAVASDGTAACWGYNNFGQLGDGTTTTSAVPVAVTTSGVLAGKTLTSISAGYAHTCAVASDGTAACWGHNNFGQLGDGTTTTSAIPVAVTTSGVLAGKTLTSISAGYAHTCAVASAGTAACWGYNHSGRLGDGTTTTSAIPVAVTTSGVLAGKTLTSISAGYAHTCAVASDGTAACWGYNYFGQLGNGTTTNSAVPTAVTTSGALAGNALTSIAAGGSHTCAVASAGTAACWGYNASGQLGNGTTIECAVPVAVTTSGALAGRTLTTISAGHAHTAALATAIPPGPPTGLSAQPGDGRLTVAFTPPASTGSAPITNYEYQLNGGGWTPLTPPVSTSPVTITGLTNLTNYTVALRAVNAAGQGAASTPVTGTPINSTATTFTPLAPVRAIDTREDTPTRPKAPLVPGTPLSVDVTALVPPGTLAVTYNATVTAQDASGYLDVSPDGAPAGTSTVNWGGPLETIANGHVTALTNGRLQLTLGGTGTAHALIDITGAFTPTTGGAGLTPDERRLYDSRTTQNPLAPGQSRTITVTNPPSASGNPTQAQGNRTMPTAAAVNLTVTDTTGTGVLSLADEPTTTTSTINWWGPRQTIANAVITKLAADGTLTVTNNGETPANFLIDLTATFTPNSGAKYYPLTPQRSYDSRTNDPPLAFAQSRTTTHPIPTQATALALNTTITGNTGTGFLSITAPSNALPTTSTINWYQPNTNRANGTITPTTNATTRAYVGGLHATHYLHDIAGFYQ